MLNTILVAVGLLVLLAGYGVHTGRAERQRLLARRALAQRFGLRSSGREAGHHRTWPQFALLQRGKDRAAVDTLGGPIELGGMACTVLAGLHAHEEPDRNRTGTVTYHFSFLVLQAPWPRAALRLEAHSLAARLRATVVGDGDAMAFESLDFQRRFRVQTDDERFARAVLHPRMQDLLLDSGITRLEIAAGALLLGDGETRWTETELAQQFDFVARFCALWPATLRTDR